MQPIITSLNPLLLLQTESIEELEIRLDLLGAQLNRELSLVIPQLKNLRKLVLSIVNLVDFFPVRQLLPSNFLKLKTLDFGNYNGGIRWLDESVVMPTVTSLHVDYYGSAANEESFHRNFPNLRKLKTTSCSFGFKAYIFTHMKSQEILQLGLHTGESGHDAIWNAFTGGAQKLTRNEIVQVCKEVCTSLPLNFPKCPRFS